jgi:hypothetical protein
MGQQNLEPPLLLPPERLLVREELPLDVLLGRGVEGRRNVPEDSSRSQPCRSSSIR